MLTENNQPTNRQVRLAIWRNLSPEIIKQLPADVQSEILSAVEEDGKQQLAQSRIAEFKTIVEANSERSHQEGVSTFIVTLVGALTFSVAPYLLASQSGRGVFALSIGFVGGGAASFYAHANATQVLTGLKLKESTKQARKAINSD